VGLASLEEPADGEDLNTRDDDDHDALDESHPENPALRVAGSLEIPLLVVRAKSKSAWCSPLQRGGEEKRDSQKKKLTVSLVLK